MRIKKKLFLKVFLKKNQAYLLVIISKKKRIKPNKNQKNPNGNKKVYCPKAYHMWKIGLMTLSCDKCITFSYLSIFYTFILFIT